MDYHFVPGYEPIPCLAKTGSCVICNALDKSHLDYDESMRRLFYPEEFPHHAPSLVQKAVSVANAVVSGAPVIPLAGDMVARVAAWLRLDRLVFWLSAKIGKDCGCATRRAKLNQLDYLLRARVWSVVASFSRRFRHGKV